MEKDAADNEAKGKEYREKFAKEKGVKTSSTGLVYQVVEAGKGKAPKDERYCCSELQRYADRR